MNLKGLSIFQRLFLWFIILSVTSVSLTSFIHYINTSKKIEHSIKVEIKSCLKDAIYYFEKIYGNPITHDLNFFQLSPTINNYLKATGNKIDIVKPRVEKLFTQTLKMHDSVYLSAKFYNARGEEKEIINDDDKRIRIYSSTDNSLQDDILYQKMEMLFKRLKSAKLGTILFEGPFKYLKNRETFVAGISKIDPNTGKFGGVIFLHCDLTDYMTYLSNIKVLDSFVIWVYDNDNKLLLSPLQKETSLDPKTYFSSHNPFRNNPLIFSDECKFGFNEERLLNIVFSVPSKIFLLQLKEMIFRTIGIAVFVILFSSIIALFISHSLTNPIAKLIKSAEIIGKGDLEHKIAIESNDEIGRLASAFNEMLEGRKQIEEALTSSEEEIRATFQSTGDAMRVISENYDIVRVNNEMGRLSGITDQELIGMKCYEQLGGEICRTDGCTLHRILAGEEHVQLETLKETKYGKKVPVEVTAAPLKIKGKTIGMVESYRDITERRKAENGLIQKTLELERSNKELEQFAYVASHDLQEPLRKIVSFTELINERYKGKFDSDADTYMMYTVDGATRMQGLINDLLNYSRVGKGEVILENKNIEDILHEALDNLNRTIKESFAKITYDSLPVLKVNSVQIRQLFQNLISNAIKFSRKEGKPYVHVSAKKKEGWWTFVVHDNGIGIEPQYAERIFQIFQRLHTRSEYSGSGIGLAICKKIVEIYGGKIWMESKKGKGSTFYFTLPE